MKKIKIILVIFSILTISGYTLQATAADDTVVIPVNTVIDACTSAQLQPTCYVNGTRWRVPDQSYFICSITDGGNSHNCNIFISTDRKQIAVNGSATGGGIGGSGSDSKCFLQSVTVKKTLTADCQGVGNGAAGCGETFIQCDNGQQECRNTCTGQTALCRGNYVACQP